MSSFYPLAVGNSWTYRTKDGKTYTSKVTALEGDKFAFTSSMVEGTRYIRQEGDSCLTDSYEAGKFQLLIKDSFKKGDAWEINYTANNFENTLAMTVKEIGMNQEIEGKTFQDVMLIEGVMTIKMNNRPVPMDYRVQYYYARGVGLILSTSSKGDWMGLVSYELK